LRTTSPELAVLVTRNCFLAPDTQLKKEAADQRPERREEERGTSEPNREGKGGEGGEIRGRG
jgi:hypothetical protein